MFKEREMSHEEENKEQKFAMYEHRVEDARKIANDMGLDINVATNKDFKDMVDVSFTGTDEQKKILMERMQAIDNENEDQKTAA